MARLRDLISRRRPRRTVITPQPFVDGRAQWLITCPCGFQARERSWQSAQERTRRHDDLHQRAEAAGV